MFATRKLHNGSRSGEAGAVEFPRTERNYHRLRRVRVRVRVGNGDNCGFAK